MEELYCLVFLTNKGSECAVKDIVVFLNENGFKVDKSGVKKVLYGMERRGKVVKTAEEGGKNPRWSSTYSVDELREKIEGALPVLPLSVIALGIRMENKQEERK